MAAEIEGLMGIEPTRRQTVSKYMIYEAARVTQQRIAIGDGATHAVHIAISTGGTVGEEFLKCPSIEDVRKMKDSQRNAR